jgi:hypothetical protein
MMTGASPKGGRSAPPKLAQAPHRALMGMAPHNGPSKVGRLKWALACTSAALPLNSWWQRWLGGKSCQGRQPPKAGAAGPTLQGLPPSHTRPPRSTAGNILSRVSQNRAAVHFGTKKDSAGQSIDFERVHAARRAVRRNVELEGLRGRKVEHLGTSGALRVAMAVVWPA